MAKALEANDNTARNQARQPADESRPEKLDGKSFQVNENSVEEGDSVHSDAPRQSHESKPSEKIEGKAFQVNENSIKNP